MAMFVTDATKKKVHEATTTTDAKRVKTWLIKKLKNKSYLLTFKIGSSIRPFLLLVSLYSCSNRNNI